LCKENRKSGFSSGFSSCVSFSSGLVLFYLLVSLLVSLVALLDSLYTGHLHKIRNENKLNINNFRKHLGMFQQLSAAPKKLTHNRF